jgi:hypothetical protein
MRVEVAIFWEADRATLDPWIDQFLKFRRNHPGGASLAIAGGPSSTFGTPRCPTPSTARATLRETRFVQCGVAVTRFRHVLTWLVRDLCKLRSREKLC